MSVAVTRLACLVLQAGADLAITDSCVCSWATQHLSSELLTVSRIASLLSRATHDLQLELVSKDGL